MRAFNLIGYKILIDHNIYLTVLQLGAWGDRELLPHFQAFCRFTVLALAFLLVIYQEEILSWVLPSVRDFYVVVHAYRIYTTLPCAVSVESLPSSFMLSSSAHQGLGQTPSVDKYWEQVGRSKSNTSIKAHTHLQLSLCSNLYRRERDMILLNKQNENRILSDIYSEVRSIVQAARHTLITH